MFTFQVAHDMLWKILTRDKTVGSLDGNSIQMQSSKFHKGISIK